MRQTDRDADTSLQTEKIGMFNDEWKVNNGFKIIRMNKQKNHIETLSVRMNWTRLEVFSTYKAMAARFNTMLLDDHTLQG